MQDNFVTKDVCEVQSRLIENSLKNIENSINRAIDDFKEKNINSRENEIKIFDRLDKLTETKAKVDMLDFWHKKIVIGLIVAICSGVVSLVFAYINK